MGFNIYIIPGQYNLALPQHDYCYANSNYAAADTYRQDGQDKTGRDSPSRSIKRHSAKISSASVQKNQDMLLL